MKHYFADFIDDVKRTHGSNLASVILYGSAAAGDFIPQESDYNILVALNKITPLELRNAHACMREWNKMGHPIPVYFTVGELQSAGDVFPIEFHQMEHARVVLHGDDVLAGLDISDKYLRHQTEFELRSKLLQLRRRYIHASTSVKALIDLMSDSLASFSALFAAVLLLSHIDPPTTKQEIVGMTVQNLGIDGKPFDKIFNIRENETTEPLTDVSANQLFADYMEQIENVIDAVDKMERP
ncbi:MAG: nucleotidyltransferase domain-containing protein [Pyrinomonadaceae bacterium]